MAMRNRRNKNANRNFKKSHTSKRKGIEDYTFYIGTTKQASDYEVTCEFIINYIKRTFQHGNDIAESLRTLSLCDVEEWKPKLTTSKSDNDNIAKIENRQFEIEFKAKLDESMKRTTTYEQNIYKAYAFLWEKCAKNMQNKISSRRDFEDTIYNDPIALLKAIKEHSLNYQETRYEMAIISDAIRTFINTKQRENEPLNTFTRRFKTSLDIMEAQIGGPITLNKYIETMPEYKLSKNSLTDQDEKSDESITIENKFIKKAANILYAYIYLENADQEKYGNILKTLNQQKSFGNDQFPKSIVEASEVLSNHNYEKNKNSRNIKNNNNEERNKSESNEELITPTLSFAQIELRCFCCGKKGHRSNKCKLKDTIPRDQWAIAKTKAQFTKGQADEDKGTETKNQHDKNGNNKQVGWANMHFSFYQTNEMYDMILLDSDSTTTIFCNKKYVSNIRNSNETLILNTNGGTLTATQICDIPFLGTHWYNEDAMTNIISLADMTKKYRVTMDSFKDKAIYVHLPQKVVKFPQLKGGLYARIPESNKSSYQFTGILKNPIDKKDTFITPIKMARAKAARQLLHSLGVPTNEELKKLISTNQIKNSKVTCEDIDLAEAVLGPDIASIKGKTTRKNTSKILHEDIQIPPELVKNNKNINLSIDTMYVNGLCFLTSISDDIHYRTAQYIPDKKSQSYQKAMKDIIELYQKAQFKVTNICCDNEFRNMLNDLGNAFNININVVPAQAHVAKAERNIRVIKERVRSNVHNLPYKKIPKTILIYIVQEAARKLNYFPVKGGISPYYSPRAIITKKALNYFTHGIHYTGEFVMAHNDENIKNNLNPRALECIYLRSSDTVYSKHELFHIQTERIITRRTCTSAKITEHMQILLENIASKQKMPQGINFSQNMDDDLFAGVYRPHSNHDQNDMTEIHQHQNEYDGIDDNNENLYQPSPFLIPDTDNNLASKEIEYNEITQQDDYITLHDEEMDNLFDNTEEEIVFENELQSFKSTESSPNNNDIEYNDIEDNTINTTQDNQEQLNEESCEEKQEEIYVEEDEIEEELPRKRSRQPPSKYHDFYQFFMENNDTNNTTIQEYDDIEASFIISFINLHSNMDNNRQECFAQTYSLEKGLSKFKEKGKEAAIKEISQLVNRKVFKPIKLEDLSLKEKQKAMNSLIFLTEKRDGTIKARACANGSVQRKYIHKEDAASPTVSVETLLTTCVIDAKQNRNVRTLDIPNAFVQTKLPENEERIIMRINGKLVELIVELFPSQYEEFIYRKNSNQVIFVEMKKALYGMMMSSLLFYKDFRKNLESIGFIVNPYDICIANRNVYGHQQTVTWHVDDVKVSHINPRANDEFCNWCQGLYGGTKEGKVKIIDGKVHDYLGMRLNYETPNKVIVDMKNYIDNMCNEYPFELNGNVNYPWDLKLFNSENDCNILEKEQKETFHTFVMKCMFLTKRSRPDVMTGVSYLSTKVKCPYDKDLKKLSKIISYLKNTINICLTLEADDNQELNWYIDSSFGVHKDMKSHTGSVFTIGKGCITSDSTKQKVNARSSTEAELIAVDDKISKVIWIKKFIENQGFKINTNVVHQDNKSTIRLENNGKYSSGKRTRHFDIKYFYVTDLIERKEVEIKFCPSDLMLADFMTKPLIGDQFLKMRKEIMNND